MGYLLVAISSVLFATLWYQWTDFKSLDSSDRERRYRHESLCRRGMANLLVGLVGIALLAVDAVPHTPVSINAYLLCLVLASLWIMWLGLADWRATLQHHNQQQADLVAREIGRAKAKGILDDA